ncbi:MAG: diguanylate cyclase [Steroidobacteraceae bacterium]|nr:diguanylate cyclase [Steroidobacteraceae bacterium]
MTADSQPSSGHWTGRVAAGLVLWVLVAIAWLQLGFGGDEVVGTVGLWADAPAGVVTVLLAWAAWRSVVDPVLRRTWALLTLALAMMSLGGLISIWFALTGRDPFPSVVDLLYIGFNFVVLAALGGMLRATTGRIDWSRLAIDAGIVGLGFGAVFWFVVVQPAAASVHERDVLRHALSLFYISFDCLLLLGFALLLVSERTSGAALRRRTLLLLTTGFSVLFVADMFWAVAKLRGEYFFGGSSDALYLLAFIPLGLAAREQVRSGSATTAAEPTVAGPAVRLLPYAAMAIAFLVLVYHENADSNDAVTTMLAVIFVLTMLVILRQSMMLRDEARAREQIAAGRVEARFASLIQNASEVVMVADGEGRLRFVSAAAGGVLGATPAELNGTHLADLWQGPERARVSSFLADVAASAGIVVGPLELELEGAGGQRQLEVIGRNLMDDHAVEGLALTVRDVSERHLLEEQLRQLAFYDPLTRLANRRLFLDRVEHALALARRSGTRVALLFVDLDDFKDVNDTLGHEAGDQVLREAAIRLLGCARAVDTVARFGGDEFAILVEGVGASVDVERVATGVVTALARPIQVSATQEARVAASVGVALSRPGDHAEALLRSADLAMYEAKARGKGQHVMAAAEEPAGPA